MAKVKKVPLVKPKIDASLLHKAFLDAVKFVQRVRFGAAVDLLKNMSPDVFNSIVKKRTFALVSKGSLCSSIGLKSLSLSFRLNRYLFCRMLEATSNPSFTCIIACFVSVAAAKGINYKQPFFCCRFAHNSFVSF